MILSLELENKATNSHWRGSCTKFLCDYHFSFCDVIPSSCIQMRNVILSAFPHNMNLRDPSTPNLKIDLLAEINQSSRIFSEVDAALKAKQMKSDVDEHLKGKRRERNSKFKKATKIKNRLCCYEPPVTWDLLRSSFSLNQTLYYGFFMLLWCSSRL
ncbi:CCR4-NOT transcription complex subunit 1 [Camellia lanceoleosa]|uniref:CCR4-NOT transcription complex subunit 1 n=1 Tax=Camellia lanceoleosa TaxID=1840588 RepID=A0ACC0FGQ7_9ERIC|nr:CCR4-NOT transcription complex subunit 1 [Camellia lanceoleosa]